MFDGQIEANAIIERATAQVTLATGGVFESIPDDHEQVVDAFGVAAPYIVISFGDPIPTAGGRGLGVGEQGQPHVLGFTITSSAGDATTLRNLAAEVNRVFIGWNPGDANSGEIRGIATTSFTQRDNESKPSRYFRNRGLRTIVNLTTPAPVLDIP